MINIAIDGPAGSGKTTVAKIISKKLDILYLDTGATYRACGLNAKINNVNVENESEVSLLMPKTEISVKYVNGAQATFLNGKDVSVDIRQNDVSSLASKISVHKCVRDKLIDLQRQIAGETSCVLDGRDIGTNVLPNAKYKFFMTASAKVRAKRRYDELISKGQIVNLEQLEREIQERDLRDSSRAIAPLKAADDALIIDTSDMTIEEVVETILKRIDVNAL